MGQSPPSWSSSTTCDSPSRRTGTTGYHVLVLEPKKRRARKRVDEVRFWLDETSYLPVKVEYLGADGSTRLVEFTKVERQPRPGGRHLRRRDTRGRHGDHRVQRHPHPQFRVSPGSNGSRFDSSSSSSLPPAGIMPIDRIAPISMPVASPPM